MTKLIILDESLMGIDAASLLNAGRAHFSALLDTIADTLEVGRFADHLKDEFLAERISSVLVGPYAKDERGDISNDLGWRLSDAFGISMQNPLMDVAAVDVMSALPDAEKVIDPAFRDFITALAHQLNLYHRGSCKEDEAHILCVTKERDTGRMERSYHALSGTSDIEFISRHKIGLDRLTKDIKSLGDFSLVLNVEGFQDVIYVGPYDKTARQLEEFGATVVAVNPVSRDFDAARRTVLNALYDERYVYKEKPPTGLRL